MDGPENSLCASCEHLAYCYLTSDKGFIWSCSEYEVSGDHDQSFQENIMKQANNLSASGGKEEVFI